LYLLLQDQQRLMSLMLFLKVITGSENYDTISGLLINRFKRLPGTHDTISFDNFKFQIKISDQRRIHSIQVEIKG
jgi:Mg2+/Co2+ transporter CorC